MILKYRCLTITIITDLLSIIHSCGEQTDRENLFYNISGANEILMNILEYTTGKKEIIYFTDGEKLFIIF